jgi:hypothetical protein
MTSNCLSNAGTGKTARLIDHLRQTGWTGTKTEPLIDPQGDHDHDTRRGGGGDDETHSNSDTNPDATVDADSDSDPNPDQ